MAWSWRAGRAVECDLCDSIADGLAVRVAIPVAVDWLLEAADDMVEVTEGEIAAAVVALDDAGIRAEAAAAAALAALPGIEAHGPIVLVVTGSNIDDELLARCRAGL
jgi:threonine dehydratase